MSPTNKSRHLKAIRQGMETPENQHDMIVIAKDDIIPYWLSFKARRGKLRRSHARLIHACVRDHTERGLDLEESIRRRAGEGLKSETIREWAQSLLSNTGNVRAAVDTGRLLKDFRGLGEYYVKQYQGRKYVIFKGNHTLRQIVKGTRYAADNPQIVNLGIGKAGRRAAARSGTLLTIAVMGAYRVAEYILNDDVLLREFVGRLSTDVVKAGVSGLLGWGASAGLASFAIGGVAGPLLVGVFVAVGTGYLLSKLDDHYQITEGLIEVMGDAVEQAHRLGRLPRQAKNKAKDGVVEAIDEAVDTLIEETKRRGERAFRHFTTPMPLALGGGGGLSLP